MDTQEMSSTIRNMSDAELGAWFRKAIIDLCSGCIALDVDPVISKCYERAEHRMNKEQNHDARKYQNRKFKEDASIREDEENHHSAAASSGNGYDETTTGRVTSESTTSSANLQGSAHDTNTQGFLLASTAAPCTQTSGNDQVTRQQSASPAEAPRGASPDSGSGNAPDETAKSSFVAIVDDRSCKSGKSGDAAKRPYGEYRHVMLTNDEGRHLREVYGSYLETAIGLLDSYIENGGKAAKKYKNHAAVLRKGNWVWQKIQDMKLSERRLENASRNGKSFAEQDREARRNFLTGNDKPEGYVDDNELTYEELIAKYGVPGAM